MAHGPTDSPIFQMAWIADGFRNWTDSDRGGHFAAMEGPNLLIGDLRTAFRGFR